MYEVGISAVKTLRYHLTRINSYATRLFACSTASFPSKNKGGLQKIYLRVVIMSPDRLSVCAKTCGLFPPDQVRLVENNMRAIIYGASGATAALDVVIVSTAAAKAHGVSLSHHVPSRALEYTLQPHHSPCHQRQVAALDQHKHDHIKGKRVTYIAAVRCRLTLHQDGQCPSRRPPSRKNLLRS